MYLHNYEIRKQISHGHFGAIYDAAHRQTGEEFAVKI
jgi:serine/threonine protein kinase